MRIPNPSPAPDPLSTTSDEPLGGRVFIELTLPLVLLPSINAGGRAEKEDAAHDGLEGCEGAGECERELGKMVASSICLRPRRVGRREMIGSRIRLRILRRSWRWCESVSPLEEKLRLSAPGELGGRLGGQPTPCISRGVCGKRKTDDKDCTHLSTAGHCRLHSDLETGRVEHTRRKWQKRSKCHQTTGQDRRACTCHASFSLPWTCWQSRRTRESGR